MSRIRPEVKRQMKFYRWMVVSPSEAMVHPANSGEEAKSILGYVRGYDTGAFIVDARIGDDVELFWSGTETGYPLES